MARRGRKAASSRGKAKPRTRGTGSRSLPWSLLALAGGALLAVFVLTRLRPPQPPPPPDTAGVPGVEQPEPSEAAEAPRASPGDAGASRRPEPSRAPESATDSAAEGRSARPDGKDVAGRDTGHAGDSAGESFRGARTKAPAAIAATATAARAPAPGAAPAAATSDAAPREGSAKLPRVAIVLDDCGQQIDLARRGARIRQPVTFAVIPHLPQSRASAEVLFSAGHEIIVHQPMEPEGADEDPGQGVLRAGMSRWRVERTLRDSLADVPHAVGLNNHMGSKATADADLMRTVLGALAGLGTQRSLYFLDSRTTPATVASEAARRAGVRTGERDVFLDNELEAGAIRGQLEALLAKAAAQGSAIGIGHLKPETLAVLEAEMPRAEGSRARFVFLGDLMR